MAFITKLINIKMKTVALIISLCFLLTGCDWPKEYVTKNEGNQFTQLKLKSDSTFKEYCTRRGIELNYEGSWTGRISRDDTISLNTSQVNGNPLSELINRKIIIKPDTLVLIESKPWDY